MGKPENISGRPMPPAKLTINKAVVSVFCHYLSCQSQSYLHCIAFSVDNTVADIFLPVMVFFGSWAKKHRYLPVILNKF
jgi:hypothetical protein